MDGQSAEILALTRGDPSGIGLEIACKAWLGGQATPFLLVDDLDHCRRSAAALGLRVPFVEATPRNAGHVFADALPEPFFALAFVAMSPVFSASISPEAAAGPGLQTGHGLYFWSAASWAVAKVTLLLDAIFLATAQSLEW